MLNTVAIARGLLIYLVSLPLMLVYAIPEGSALAPYRGLGLAAALAVAAFGSFTIFQANSDPAVRRGFAVAMGLDLAACVLALLNGLFHVAPLGGLLNSLGMTPEPLALHVFGTVAFMIGLNALSALIGRTIHSARLYRFLGICLVGGFLLLFRGNTKSFHLDLMVLIIQLALAIPLFTIRSAVLRYGAR